MNFDLRLSDIDRKRISKEGDMYNTLRTISEEKMKEYNEKISIWCFGSSQILIQYRDDDEEVFHRFYGVKDFLRGLESDEEVSLSKSEALNVLRLYGEAEVELGRCKHIESL